MFPLYLTVESDYEANQFCYILGICPGLKYQSGFSQKTEPILSNVMEFIRST
jgi:hypothetical protein